MHSSLRQATGRICSTLGILWAGAGAMKELFGTHVMAGFLPPLDLQRVNEGSALFIGCCLYFVGAWLTRTPNSFPNSSGEEAVESGVPAQRCLAKTRSAATLSARSNTSRAQRMKPSAAGDAMFAFLRPHQSQASADVETSWPHWQMRNDM